MPSSSRSLSHSGAEPPPEASRAASSHAGRDTFLSRLNAGLRKGLAERPLAEIPVSHDDEPQPLGRFGESQHAFRIHMQVVGEPEDVLLFAASDAFCVRTVLDYDLGYATARPLRMMLRPRAPHATLQTPGFRQIHIQIPFTAARDRFDLPIRLTASSEFHAVQNLEIAPHLRDEILQIVQMVVIELVGDVVEPHGERVRNRSAAE